MINMRVAALVSLGLVVGGEPVLGQASFSYREYMLGSSVASVVKVSGARASDTRTPHERPARIQQLEWHAPYVLSTAQLADPVRDMTFSFYDDQLFQVVVTYDRGRMEGLTTDDVVESLSATYGKPLRADRQARRTAWPSAADAKLVAKWENAESLLTLTRGTYSPDFQLVLVSKTLKARATAAIKESMRLDAAEAPRREMDRRKKEVADARAETAKARITNKAAFKP